MLRIGIDAGGTFTDFVVLDDGGRLTTFKLRSNRANPAEVILTGIARAAANAPAAEVLHGSTVATNALLERKGARTAFLTTAGFEDLLAIGRQNRAALYDLTPQPTTPLIPSERCFGIAERVLADGTIAVSPSPADLERLRRQLAEKGVESIAICFLHAYQVPDNEQAVGRALHGLCHLSLSSEIAAEFREYERASTAAVNAYVGPLMRRYLEELAARSPYPVLIMQSNGGVLSAHEAGQHAVRTVLSGPAGGVVGAFETATAGGFPKVLGFDMGGTSTDVSLCDGKPRETVEARIDGMPIRVPMLDIHTVGAGGGSIARVDEGGLLRVGPESAGSTPGPACYGTGDLPTVTDAHVVLGRIAADQLVGGDMTLDTARAKAALARLGQSLGMDPAQAAAGVIRIANANMERAIRAVSIERGYDPRDFALLAFGGCGGLHACEMAAELGIVTVLVPENAGVLSALGMLLAPRVRDYAAGVLGHSDLDARFLPLEARARAENPKARLTRFVDLRYVGQSYELTIPWTGPDAIHVFHSVHERTYGYANPTREVEAVTIRLRATSAITKPPLTRSQPYRKGQAQPRQVWVDGASRQIPAWRREQLSSRPVPGPALVLDYGATTLVPSAWSMRIDSTGTLVLRRRGIMKNSA
ncbi:MAG: hydantoinase/oxoprolinase family protein [Bryobacterales bacterium]|nr:hydantoinase/oxoprolinase family protein [Bryobacterales bacterium]